MFLQRLYCLYYYYKRSPPTSYRSQGKNYWWTGNFVSQERHTSSGKYVMDFRTFSRTFPCVYIYFECKWSLLSLALFNYYLYISLKHIRNLSSCETVFEQNRYDWLTPCTNATTRRTCTPWLKFSQYWLRIASCSRIVDTLCANFMFWVTNNFWTRISR